MKLYLSQLVGDSVTLLTLTLKLMDTVTGFMGNMRLRL